MDKKIMEELEKLGITSRTELSEAIKKLPPLNLSLMLAEPRDKAKEAS